LRDCSRSKRHGGTLPPQLPGTFLRNLSAGMEPFLSRAVIIVALTCLLMVGAVATSILNSASVPMPRVAAEPAAASAPVSNWESKQDKLAVAGLATAAFETADNQASDRSRTVAVSEAPSPEPTASLRQAYASAEPTAPVVVKALAPAAPAAPSVAAAPKPKPVSKPAPQKQYALLSDAQISGIKQRLRLTADQEYYWPAVETALRAVARKIHSRKQADPNAMGAPPIDPDSEEVQQLKSAAMPLLFQLREDQKNEVRHLARLIGLERVAAMI
jgi:hypothetical protein